MQWSNSDAPIPAGRSNTRRRLWWALAGLTTAAMVAALALFVARTRAAAAATPELTYSAMVAAMDAGRVDSIAVVPGQEIEGWWRAGASPAAAPAGASAAARGFRVVFSQTDANDLLARAEQRGVSVAFRGAGRDRVELVNLLVSLTFLGVFGFVIVRQLQNPQGNGDLGARGRSSTTFANVAGNEGVVAELREVVEFLRDPSKYAKMGARTPKGVLMFGPPGTGKTLMARAVAGEAAVPFYSISGSEVTGFIVGLGVRRIRSLFKKARKTGGVIFIDEIDALGGRRGRNQSHNEDDRTLNQLLVEMDGFAATEGVVVLAATNRQEDLDPALLRAGRFDRSVVVGLPTATEREQILRLHVAQRQVPLGAGVDLGRLARLMVQANGADLANLINEAAISAAREGEAQVEWNHIEAARDRFLLGKERTGFRATALEWRIVAIHEAGHAVAGVLCCPEDGLHKVTIQPRGRAMGVAFFSPDDDRHLHSRHYLEGQILKALGGRAAEEIVFGDQAITSGARSDLQHATRIAKDMIYHLGMGRSSGLMVYDTQNGPVSGDIHAAMDREVRELLDGMYARVRGVLLGNRAALEALAQALLEHETVEGDEALRILEANGLSRAPLQVVA
ncbi:MAG TPA: AAA family ATPase [Gemmatimonadales bacterium]|nr:AAA family ATPase [Gemmatimonadales bacterium]